MIFVEIDLLLEEKVEGDSMKYLYRQQSSRRQRKICMIPMNSLNGSHYFRRGGGCLDVIFEKRISGVQCISQPFCWNGIGET